jgi:hypothetical protein
MYGCTRGFLVLKLKLLLLSRGGDGGKGSGVDLEGVASLAL